MENFEQVLDRHGGIGPGFDFLRIFLAVLIVLVHSILLTGHRKLFTQSPAWFLLESLVPMFFALSGFLITPSAIRLSLKNFMINRGLRIVPALAVDVVICALIIGPVFTSIPLGDYFLHQKFHVYFFNVIGNIHYLLPGIFQNNLSHDVNGALWTVPYELLCYIIAAFFIVTNLIKSKVKIAILMAIMLIAGAFFSSRFQSKLPINSFYIPGNWSDFSDGSRAVEAFLFGVIAYQWRATIKYSKTIFFICILICLGAALWPDAAKINAARIILLPALTYITLFIGLTAIPTPSYFKKGDYSYGIYLYHDPLMQCIIAIFPAIAMSSLFGTAFTFFSGMVLVLFVSNFSWHLIEKPILSMRKKFSFVARVRDLGVDKISTGASENKIITDTESIQKI